MSIRPLVHMNGSSGERLVDDLTSAAQALTDALAAVAAAAPNQRDYYPLSDGAWTSARDAHERHVRLLRDLRTEYLVAAEHVQEQIDRREANRAKEGR